jgi:hypothetical protein
VGCRSRGLRFAVCGGLFPIIFSPFYPSAMHSYQNALDFSINAMPTSSAHIGAGIQ